MKAVYLIKNLPLILLFLLSSRKEFILSDMYSRKPSLREQGFISILNLATELQSSYFRKLFYFRINNWGSKFLRIFYPGERTFIIDIRTDLGSGVQLAHPYSTIINAASIGKNLYINHLVTIGEKDGKRPVIGNNVQLHAGAMVIGGVTVGDYAVIGAGAVVVKDVPSNCIVVGNPARIIQS